MRPHSPFVRDTLVPDTVDGGHNRFYQLNEYSVCPTRIVGSDELGMPIEERYPIAYSEKFVGLDGCIKDVPLYSAPVPDNEESAIRYKNSVLRDMIRGGQLPLASCPYTSEYRDIKRGPLVAIPAGDEVCDGKPDGCEHMQKVIKARLATWRAKWDREQEQIRSMKPEDAERIAASVAEGVGRVLANASDLRPNRRAMARTTGEAD